MIASSSLTAPEAFDPLDPVHFADVRKPFTRASTPPPWFYTDGRVFDREIDRIFLDSWIFVGHESQIPHPGDYRTFVFHGHGVIVARDRAGAPRAFANTCRHRGARVASGCGNRSAFVCPYHAWTYDLDGRLRKAPGMDRVDGFDRTEHGLVPVRLESWCGLMFIALRDGVPPLADHLGDLPVLLAPYRIEEMVCTDRRYDVVETNWKLYIEVDMETYHTPVVHPRSIGDQPVEWLSSGGAYETVFHRDERTVSLAPGDGFEGFDRIRDEQGGTPAGTCFTTILPSLFLVTAVDSMWWIHKVPIAPDRTGVEVARAFPRRTVERSDFARHAPRYYERWDAVIDEDNAITEIQFEGIRSPLARPGRYAPEEGVLHRIDNWVLDRILDPAPAPAATPEPAAT